MILILNILSERVIASTSEIFRSQNCAVSQSIFIL